MEKLYLLFVSGSFKVVCVKDIKSYFEESILYSPDVECIGYIGYSRELEKYWDSRLREVSLSERGGWYKIEDEEFIREARSVFVNSDVDKDEDEVSKRINTLYRQMLKCLDFSKLFPELRGCDGGKDRLIVYCRHLKGVGRECFKYYKLSQESERNNRMAGVYYFSGQIWEQINDVEFDSALEKLCLTNMGVNSSEWLKCCRMFSSKVRDGARLSELKTSKSIVGFSNGVFDFTDLNNIIYHPFTDMMPVVSLLPYDYTLSASCPLWESFLKSCLDVKQRGILQKFFSLGLVDRSTMSAKIENSLWLVGPGGAGKSTILDTMTFVYGAENVSSAPLGDLVSGNSISRPMILGSIVGKVFNSCAEAQATDITGKSDTFKSLCSGEPQVVRRIGRDYETSYEIPYLVFSMNSKPRLSKIDNSISRRLVFIVFKSAIREIDRDPELRDKLKAEAAGIRNWLIRGYKMLVEDEYKIEETEISSNEMDSWMIENGQTVELFMKRNKCRPYSYTGQTEKSQWFPVKVLFDRYSAWCRKWGYEMDCDLNGMGRELRRIGYMAKRTSVGIVYQVYGGEKIK